MVASAENKLKNLSIDPNEKHPAFELDSGSLARELDFFLELYHYSYQQILGFAEIFPPLESISSFEAFKDALSELFSLSGIGISINQEIFDQQEFRLKTKHCLGKTGSYSLEDLCLFYETSIQPQSAKKEGIFYTPQKVVDQMTADALSYLGKNDKREPLMILDPCCGSGIFLLSAFRYLTSLPSSNPQKVLAENLYAFDKNQRVIEIAKLILRLACFEASSFNLKKINPKDLKTNFQAKDSLLESLPLAWQKKYDCIIGNPPYGLKRGEQLSKEDNQVIKKHYEDFIKGKVNKYVAFIGLGYSLLKEGGVLSFIVPNAWLGISAGVKLRKLLVREQALKKICRYNLNVFQIPSVEVVSFIAQKGVKDSSIAIIELAETKNKALFCETKAEISIDAILKNPDLIIPLYWSNEIENLLKKIDLVSEPLKDGRFELTPKIAIQAYALGKGMPPQTQADVKNHSFHSKTKLDENYYPYLEGADLSSFRVQWSGRYLNYGPWLAEPQKLERFSGARIAIREIIAKSPYLLQATFLDEISFYNKSVLHILPTRAPSEEKLMALLAILNSKLASFVILFRGRKAQRKLFKKIVNADLKDFPLPVKFDNYQEKLASLASQAIRELSNSSKENIKLIRDQIDHEVCRAYELKDRDLEAINSALKNSPFL